MLEQGISQQLAAISPQDLALMAHIGAEISDWERAHQLPMASNDAQALRSWLLARLDEIGVAPEARARRRAARDKAWRELAIELTTLSRSQPSTFSSFHKTITTKASWTYCGPIPSALRHLAFWTHWGAPSGYRIGPSPQAAFVLHVVAIMLASAAYPKNLLAAALCAGGLAIALRMALWLAAPAESRLAFHAQAALPHELRWLNARRARHESEREDSEIAQGLTPNGPTLDILSAVEAASLGCAPIPAGASAENPRDALLAQRAERKAKLLAAARDPLSVHARLERERLEAAIANEPIGAALGSAPPRL